MRNGRTRGNFGNDRGNGQRKQKKKKTENNYKIYRCCIPAKSIYLRIDTTEHVMTSRKWARAPCINSGFLQSGQLQRSTGAGRKGSRL